MSGDSHHPLPHDQRDLAEREADLYPFLRQIESGIEALMPAHIVYPQIDERPAGYSPQHIAALRHYGFEGAIISDDLDMAGAQGIADPGERIQAALAAGADVTLMCNDLAAIRQALCRNYHLPDAANSVRRLAALRARPIDTASAAAHYRAAQELLQAHAADLV